jgi:hypothetical protein
MRIGNNSEKALKSSLERLPKQSSKNNKITLRVRLAKNIPNLPENIRRVVWGDAILLDFSLGYQGLKIREDGFSVSMMFMGEMTHLDILWSSVSAWDEKDDFRMHDDAKNVVFVDFKCRKKLSGS